MKAPESLETLVDYGIIQEVVRPLMSGKEAQVYVVVAAGEECVAKVYKEATHRNFRQRSEYTEGRRTRNTRDQRAMNKRTNHGRRKDEDAWRSTEVDMIYRLRDAGVRVPEPLNFVEGVLVMELVTDADGNAAPRLGDITYSPEKAKEIYHALLREVVRMLCAGVVHGDLSEFNVLMGKDGPVVIDFPQSVDPTLNPNSKKLLLRDVANLHRFLNRFAPEEQVLPYGEEIWKLFETNKLKPDTKLTGHFEGPKGKVNTDEVMSLIDDANRDERRRRQPDGEDEDDDAFDGPVRSLVKAGPVFRKVVDFSQERAANRKGRPEPKAKSPGERRTRTRRKASGSSDPAPPRKEEKGPRGDDRSRGRGRSRTQSPAARAGDAERMPPAGPKSQTERNPPAGPKSQTEQGPTPPRKRRSRRRRPAGEKRGESNESKSPSTPSAGRREGGDRDARRTSNGPGSAASSREGGTGTARRRPRTSGPQSAGNGPPAERKPGDGAKPARRRRSRRPRKPKASE